MQRLDSETRARVLQALHAIQDAEGMLLGLHIPTHPRRISEVMARHREASTALLCVLGGHTDEAEVA